jgi:hypothetical protein
MQTIAERTGGTLVGPRGLRAATRRTRTAAPTSGATATSRRSSRQHAGRRDPRRRRTQHPSYLRRSLEHQTR